jgi:hypothetical protein
VRSSKFRMMHNVDMVDDIVYSFCLKWKILHNDNASTQQSINTIVDDITLN